jgi:DNA-binding GntR family transcriptional regulator
MTAMVWGENLPALHQVGKDRVKVLPAAGYSVEEDKRRTIARPDCAIKGPAADRLGMFLHSLHARLITPRVAHNNRLDGWSGLRILHAVFTTQHKQPTCCVKRGMRKTMLRLTEDGTPLVRQTLVDSVYQTLLEAILAGKIASGANLNEVAVARELGVSRTPVHEALAWLAADELIELSGSRARVRTMTAAEVEELYDVRRLLEGTAAERAARQIDDAVLQKLREESRELARTREHADWPARAIDFDIRFHDLVAQASGNSRLRSEIQRYRLLVRAICRITGGHLKNLQDSFQEHLAILRALEKRDPKAARKAMEGHIERRVKVVLAEVYHDRPNSSHPA